jgi:hypothetical protein
MGLPTNEGQSGSWWFEKFGRMHVVEYNLEITVTKPHINVYLVDMVSADFANRPIKKLVLFDVDGTLTLARKVCHNRE